MMIASIGEKTFNSEVLGSSIPVVVNFWTPWCGPCKLIEPLILQLQDRIANPLKVVRVNADENFWLSKRFNITTLPTVLVLHEGKVVHRLEGMTSRDEVLKNLQIALNRTIVRSQSPMAVGFR